MLQKFRHSYFGRLFLYYMLLSVLLVALTGFLVLTSSASSIQNSMRQQTRSGVQAVSDSLDVLLQHCAEVIRELSLDKTVYDYLMKTGGATRYDLARILYLSGVNFPSDVSSHIVRIADGEIVSTSEASEVFARENYNENYTLFKRILEADDVAVYTTVKGIRMRSDTRIILAKAVRSETGAPIGYVVIEVSRNALASIVTNYSFVSNLPIMLVDPYDVVIFSSEGEDAEGLAKLQFADDFTQMWDADDSSGVFQKDNLCWAKADFARYAVVSEVSPVILNSALKSSARAGIPVLVMTCLIGMVFAYLVARTVSAPIRKLTLAMGEAEKGNFRARVPVTSRDELGQLSDAFNHMQLEIEELIAHIEEKQRSLRVAEVNALALQVNPHFLYNTLDLIKWSIKLGRLDDALNIIVRLGKLLRRLMNNKNDVVPVSEEMEIVRAFLEIQQYRQGGGLDVVLDLDPSLDGALIPKLVLQPLIENAIVHGLENKPSGGVVRITSRRAGDYLQFVVEDNGKGMSQEKLADVMRFQPNGMYNIALSNVNQRARLYGDDLCGLRIESAPGEGTVITLILKYVESPNGN